MKLRLLLFVLVTALASAQPALAQLVFYVDTDNETVSLVGADTGTTEYHGDPYGAAWCTDCTVGGPLGFMLVSSIFDATPPPALGGILVFRSGSGIGEIALSLDHDSESPMTISFLGTGVPISYAGQPQNFKDILAASIGKTMVPTSGSGYRPIEILAPVPVESGSWGGVKALFD